jgi:hypothetical protein
VSWQKVVKNAEGPGLGLSWQTWCPGLDVWGQGQTGLKGECWSGRMEGKGSSS